MSNSAVVCLFLCLFTLTTASSSVAEEKARLERITPRVYAFIGTEGDANSGFVVTDEGVVIIDSQMNPQLAEAVLTEIRKITDKPLLYLINTHYHGDHTFANHVYPVTKGIIAHENTQKALKDGGEALLKRFVALLGEEKARGIKVTLPTLTFKETMPLELKGMRMELLYLGRGHTEGDIVVYLPEEKVLFSGDLVYAGRLPWVGDGNTRDWIVTLGRIKSLDVRTVVPGHGKGGARESIATFEGYLTSLRAEVMRLFLRGLSLEEIKSTVQLPAYQEWLKYREWLPLNAEKVYRELLP